MLLLRTVLRGPEKSLLGRLVNEIVPGSVRMPSLGISLQWPWSWSGIFQAAPKKRTSHQKKRQRQLAGNNQQKPIRSLNKCPACGHVKRAHTLCMNCVQQIRRGWRQRDREEIEASRDPSKFYDESKLSPEDRDFNYPKRINRPSVYQEKLADRDSYVLKYPKTLSAKPRPLKEKKLPMLLRRPYR